MGMLSALLAHCEGNLPVTNELLEWSVIWSYGVFFYVSLNKVVKNSGEQTVVIWVYDSSTYYVVGRRRIDKTKTTILINIQGPVSFTGVSWINIVFRPLISRCIQINCVL